MPGLTPTVGADWKTWLWSDKDISLAAVEEGQELVKRCIAMAKQLRGTDSLANRVRQLRQALEALEGQVDLLLR